MQGRLRFYLLYFISWIAFFELGRAIFLVINAPANFDGGWAPLIKLFWHGLALDISTTGYILLIPFCLALVRHFFSFDERRLLGLYTLIVLALAALIVGIDTKLYSYWGFRVDSTPIFYLETPEIVMKSLVITDIINPLLISSLLFFLFRKIFNILYLPSISARDYKLLALHFLLFLSLILPIRGGLGVAPINIGRAYHSEITFLNHSAINPVWNLIFSLLENRKLQPIRHQMTEAEAQGLVQGLNKSNPNPPTLLKTKNPNVLIVILESFSSKLMDISRNGNKILPNLQRIASEGLFFENIYASGDRTDKGLVAILSGYPAQPGYSIMKSPRKAQSLPNLLTTFGNENYSTAFIYAGDMNFANMKAYIQQAAVEHLITREYFSSDSDEGKWGVHDHIMLDSLYHLIQRAEPPFFYAALTLSSHEPFTVPGASKFPLSNDTEKFLNAARYTDEAVGRFVSRLKESNHWDDLLLIFIADHGHRLPGNDPIEAKSRFQIPMIWTGGALDSAGTKSQIGSQIDLASTLLHQLDIKSPYEFSRNLFSEQISFAYYAYNNGYGVLFDNFEFQYNQNSGESRFQGLYDDHLSISAKAYFEALMYDFEGR